MSILVEVVGILFGVFDLISQLLFILILIVDTFVREVIRHFGGRLLILFTSSFDWASVSRPYIFFKCLFSLLGFFLNLISFHDRLEFKIPVSNVPWLDIFIWGHVVDVPSFALTKLANANSIFKSVQFNVIIIRPSDDEPSTLDIVVLNDIDSVDN